MKYNKALMAVITLGFAATSFAGPGRGNTARVDAERVRTEATKQVEEARRTLEVSGLNASKLLDQVVKVDVALSTARGEKSEMSKALEALGKTAGENPVVRAAGMKAKIENSLSEVSKSLEKVETELTKAENDKEALSAEALELASVNEAILKLVTEAIKTGEESSFDNIVKMQEALEGVDFKDSAKVAAAKAALLEIAKVEKLEEIIKCKV
ncbi:MAG: hypothetical protein ACRBBP_06575 [Bdellovibrionales bacterium]